MKKHKIAKEVKDQIIDRIKNGGVSVSRAGQEHGVSVNTIYTWLSRKTDGSPGALETVRLRKENKELKELVGEITLQMSKSKKKTWS